MANQQGVIKAFMKALDITTAKGSDAIDAAVKACSNFGGVQAVITQMVSDCKNAKSADDFLKTYCGINLSNKDTGAITGFDAGGSSIKTAESIVPENNSLNTNFKSNSFTVNGLKVNLGKLSGSSVVNRNFSDLSDQEIYLWQSLYSYWMKSGLDLIAESFGSNFSFNANSTTSTLYVVFDYKNEDYLGMTSGGPYQAQKSTNNLRMSIYFYYYGNAVGENGKPDNDSEYLDRTVAHELTHAVMRANIDYFDYLPQFIKEGAAELVHGIDDTRTSIIKKLAGNSTLLEQSLSLNDTGTGNENAYAAGYMFLRYLARQAGDLTLSNTVAKKTIKTFDGNDTVTNWSGGKSSSINLGSGDDSVKNTAANVTIIGGKGNDTITNSGSNVLFKYNLGDGNDLIQGFYGSSTLQIGDGTGTYSSTKSSDGKDIIVTVGISKKITLSGAASLSSHSR